MVKRRTLGEGLTPEEEAFLNPAEPLLKQEPELALETEMAAPIPVAGARIEPGPAALQPEHTPVPPAPSPAQPSVVFTLQAPEPGMVGLTTRIPAGISMALMAAAMQRKIQRRAPFTHQDIVTEALEDWLKRNNFI